MKLLDQPPVSGGTTAIRDGKYVREERAPGPPSPPPCRHRYIETFEFIGARSIWACEECHLRFYPACRTCVDVGHRNEEHPDD